MTGAREDDPADLLVHVEDRIALLTMNRPQVMNAFSGTMATALSRAYERCDADDEIRVVVLTGSGRAFCAGADFSAGASVFAAPSDRSHFRSDPFTFHAWDVRKPVIAAINGHAVGLGLTMALQCDIRIIAEQARCGVVQNRRGVLPDLRSHWTLPRLIGHARATELLLSGRMFSGSDAADWGLATEALDAADVVSRAMEIARDIAVNTAPVSVGLSKRLLWLDQPSSAEIDEFERLGHLHLMDGPDAQEGVRAFMDERDPEWTMSPTDDWPDWAGH